MIKRFFYTVFLFFFFSGFLNAQTIPVDDAALARTYPLISTIFNRIFNSSGLDSFYQKLRQLKKDSSDVVSIVHIGDSHIQADFLSDVLRDGLQSFFGNAGRGLIFPYQLALSNAPDDIKSASAMRWQFNRLAHPEIPIASGISGYTLTSNNPETNIDLSLRTDIGQGFSYFNRLKFFLDTNPNNTWLFKADNLDSTYILQQEPNAVYREVTLTQPINGFSLSSLSSGSTKEFYGVSLENSNPGVLYHTIGVNGARYDQYNIAPLFWKQLPALKADLYIISLGTNEAQRAAFAEAVFVKELTSFIDKLKQASPGASILITTAPDSYKARRYFNPVLKQLNQALSAYCNKHFIPVWDLYRITNGYGSASRWAKRGLMSRDKVHFTAEGYRLQGNLLFNALAKGYNDYISNY